MSPQERELEREPERERELELERERERELELERERELEREPERELEREPERERELELEREPEREPERGIGRTNMTKARTKQRARNPLAALIGSRIAHAREVAGVTQEALAKAVEVDRLHVSAIENGRRLPSVTLLVAIADTLGVGIGDFVAGRK